MEEEKRKAYSEVVEILKLIEDEEKLAKIPFEVIELIKKNADPAYSPKISKEIPIEEQGLRTQTYSILAWIASKYWGENLMQEQNIEQKGESQKEEIEKTDIKDIVVYNDIEPEILEKTKLPILVSHLKWYEKIKIKVIKLLKLLFKKSRNNLKEGVD